MRVEPFGVGSFIHVMKRGARGMPIVSDQDDRMRFARSLYLINEAHRDENWVVKTSRLGAFDRPADWPERKPLVGVRGWVLMPNHFHLLLEEVQEGGTAKFMQRLCGSMSSHFNAKYKEKGSLFQGAYKSRTVGEDRYLRQLAPYIMTKNVFELYPGGYKKALGEFERAWQWACTYQFSSLPEYAGKRDWPIAKPGLLGEMFHTAGAFKSHAHSVLKSRPSDLLKQLSFE